MAILVHLRRIGEANRFFESYYSVMEKSSRFNKDKILLEKLNYKTKIYNLEF